MDIPITTTFTIEGSRIKEYKGIVRGLVVRSPTVMQGLMGGLKSIIGGNIEAYTEMCEQTRSQAYALMVEHAKQMGANAVVGLHYDASDVGTQGGGATEVLCYGTAVVIEKGMILALALAVATAAGAAEPRSPLFNFEWDKAAKQCVINYNESWAMALKIKKAEIALRSACRYDDKAAVWRRHEGFSLSRKSFKTRPWMGTPRKDEPKMGVFAKERGLYFVRWTENGEDREAPAYCSDFLCNDVHLGPNPPGQVAICVPEGRAMFVPDPKISCP